jgi:lipopolysaccharide/colanic/teichoic acid biosynthesis glycosyltransferase
MPYDATQAQRFRRGGVGFEDGAAADVLVRRVTTICAGLALITVWTSATIWFTGGLDLWLSTRGTRMHLLGNIGFTLLAATHAGLTRGLLDGRIKRAVLFTISIFGVFALAIIMGRLFFSRPMLASTLVQAVVVATMVVFLRKREGPSRIAIIAGGAEQALDSVPGAYFIDDPGADLREYDTVLVSSEEMASPLWARTLSRAMLAGAKVRHVGEYHEDSRGAVSLHHFDLQDVSTHEIASYKSLKRAVDIALVMALAPLAIPLVLVSALAILATSRGPVFFLQQRVGLGGQPFMMWKLRTMRVHAPDPQLRAAVAGDSRITRLGAILRRFRIDELPQLWNVLKGEMSLIGPRPEASPLHAVYMEKIPHYAYRYLVRPGITGWAQVSCPPSATADEARTKLTYDLFYVKHVSPVLDAKIVVRTFWTLLEGGGVR